MAAACGSSDSGGQADAGPFTTALRCPDHGPLPFVLDDQAWRFEANSAAAGEDTRIKHAPADIIANPALGVAYTDVGGEAPLESGSLRARGVAARTAENDGLFSSGIPGELVSVWEYSDAAGWQQLGSQETTTFQEDVSGGYDVDLGLSLPDDQEVVARYAVLNADQSCAAHYQFSLATGRKVVLADIDGTLTAGDDELLTQITDGDYDPLEKTGAGDLMRAWAAKGYQVVYLTARPHLFRSETRRWLDDHDYPIGALLTATDYVFNESARMHKAAWIRRLLNDLQWDVVAVYGNATSDIDAYDDAGMPKQVTFIIGEHAGESGTVAIENDDYTSHIADYVMQQPDAQ